MITVRFTQKDHLAGRTLWEDASSSPTEECLSLYELLKLLKKLDIIQEIT